MHYPKGDRELDGLRHFGDHLRRMGLLNQVFFPEIVASQVKAVAL